MIATPTIAIIDDDPDSRATYAASARIAGFNPYCCEQRFRRVEEVLDEANGHRARFALCDHRLTEGHYARFTGAEIVARFYDAGIPAVLVTSYLRSDVETTIRPFRRRIPRLLSGISPDSLRAALEACKEEVVDHEIPMERRGCRAVLSVKELSPRGNETVVRVRITQWSTTDLAGFPLSMVPDEIRTQVKVGAFLFATVNTGAVSADDLFFEDFQLPHPDDVKAIRAQFGGR
jgi:FixJ family two-component response regulator